MPDDKSTPLLSIKTILLCVIFFTHGHLFVHKIYSLQVWLQVVSFSHR